MTELSVVIPALDEAQVLPHLLSQLSAQSGVEIEVIVADGGSTDGTADLACINGAKVVNAPPGRGRQMNAAARTAHGELLLFLHADSGLPQPRLAADAVLALRQAIEQAGHDRIAGHFPLRFTGTTAGHELFYRYLEGKTRLNRPYTINGDQGLLISRAFFEQLGGFDESLPFLEDQRIAGKIFARGRWLVLPGGVDSSARRFETEGHAQRYTLMALIMGLHAGGADEFFTRAPRVYDAHTESGRLDLRPHLQLIEQVLCDRGFIGRWALLYRIGRFIRENAWQLSYRRDVLHGDEHFPRLRFHDRYVAPLLRNPLADALAAMLARAWLLFILPRWVKSQESGREQVDSG